MALIVALIVLAAMSLAAAALVRAVDTTTAIAGNLAFRDAAIASVDLAIEEAWAALFEDGRISDRDQNLLAQGYYAARQPGEDVRGVPQVLQAADRYPAAARVIDAGNGNTQRYIIERLCLHPGPSTPAHCALLRPPGAPAAGADAEPIVPTISLFRVTVRVDGPQGTVTHAQAMLRASSPPKRMSWRLLVE
jgi:hypothetical protein